MSPPASLTDETLFRGEVPAAFGPLLASLSALETLVLREQAGSEERNEARILYDAILAASSGITDGAPASIRRGTEAFRRWFARGVLLWERFEEVVDPDEVLDTVRSQTLRRFPVDLPANAHARQRLRRALSASVGLTTEAVEELARDVEFRCDNLALKRRLTAALRRTLAAGGEPGALPTPEARLELMRRVYGPVPLQPGEVDLVVTASAIFFCIPYEGDTLAGPAWDARDDAARAEVRAMLATLHQANSALTGRFPSFGMLDRERLDGTLVTELTAELSADPAYASLRPEVVRETLLTMTSVLSTRLLEQYLVHDAWGHVWQEALCDFEGPYSRLRHVLDPISPDTGPFFGGPGTPRLAESFVVRDGGVQLEEGLLRRVVEADARGRVVAGITGVLSETLADLVEWKLLRIARPDPEDFPQSSLLPDAVVKLDLTLKDVRQHVRWWRRPYRRLRKHRAERDRLVMELRSIGLPEPGLPPAVERAASLAAEWLAPLHDDALPSPEAIASGGPIPAGFLARFLVQMSCLARELEHALAPALAFRGADRWRTPEACVDLLVVLLGTFYEMDRPVLLWHLDELVRDDLAPALEALGRALERDDEMRA